MADNNMPQHYFDLMKSFPTVPISNTTVDISKFSGSNLDCLDKYDSRSAENMKYWEILQPDEEDQGYDFVAFVSKDRCVEVGSNNFLIYLMYDK